MSKPKRPVANAKQGSTPKWVLPVVIAGVAILGVIVMVTTIVGGSKSSSNNANKAVIEVADVVSVDGAALPPLPDKGADPAVGQVAPTLNGVTFNGSAVSIPGKGPAIIAFVAHWCPHCQREVPLMVKLRQSGNWPSNVALSGVSTAVAAERGNYPPSAWLQSVGWDAPVLVDTKDGTASNAYGLSGFPFLTWIDANGKVVLRTAGEIPEATLTRMVQELSKGQTPTLTQS